MTAVYLLQSLLSIFLSSVAPPLSIATMGYLLGRSREVSIDGLSAVTVYILLPALVFETLVTTSIDIGTVTNIAGVIVTCAVSGFMLSLCLYVLMYLLYSGEISGWKR